MENLKSVLAIIWRSDTKNKKFFLPVASTLTLPLLQPGSHIGFLCCHSSRGIGSCCLLFYLVLPDEKGSTCPSTVTHALAPNKWQANMHKGGLSLCQMLRSAMSEAPQGLHKGIKDKCSRHIQTVRPDSVCFHSQAGISDFNHSCHYHFWHPRELIIRKFLVESKICVPNTRFRYCCRFYSREFQTLSCGYCYI